MKKKTPAAGTAEESWGAKVKDVVSANYLVARPFGGGLLGEKPRYQLTQDEHLAIGTLSGACDEFPALHALARWAEANGAPAALLEAWESAKHGARWAVEGREQPEGWKPYRNVCRRCGKPKETWQEYCGAACSAQRDRPITYQSDHPCDVRFKVPSK